MLAVNLIRQSGIVGQCADQEKRPFAWIVGGLQESIRNVAAVLFNVKAAHCAHSSRIFAVAGPNGEYPRRVSAMGGLYIEKDGRDIPDTFLMTADYPSEWSLFLVSTLTNDAGLPDKIYGKHGTMELGGEPLLGWNGDFKEEVKASNDGKEEVRLAIHPRRDLGGNV